MARIDSSSQKGADRYESTHAATVVLCSEADSNASSYTSYGASSNENHFLLSLAAGCAAAQALRASPPEIFFCSTTFRRMVVT